MNNEKKDGTLIFYELIMEKAYECRNLDKKYSKSELDIHYFEFCHDFINDLINLYQKIQNKLFVPEFDSYNFFCAFIFGFFNFITETPQLKKNKISMLQYNLLVSSMQKYKDIIHLTENQQYESAFILFRALYENLIILCFLNFNNCLEELSDFSFYNLFSEFKEFPIDKNMEDRLNRIKNKYNENDLNQNYGWARKFIKKDSSIKIYFTDILDCVIEKNDLFKNMYYTSSLLVHSNNIMLTDYRVKDIIKKMLCFYIEKIGISLLTKCFYDMFMEKNYFDSNLFLKLAEYSMKKYNIEIWGIR